ncbi:MAG: SDR family NAD(P)-dependent oxidoreductase [Lysobacter sp.]|nr:SDR family NAD(P)-dependent oxidoreductase [Lysobacter sp.]
MNKVALITGGSSGLVLEMARQLSASGHDLVLLAYAAAKGGLNNFADAIRRELLPRGIKVHLACPGDIDTPMYAGELEHMPAWIKEKMGRGKPMKADVAARHILKMCFRDRFRIDLSGDVMLLVCLQKLLPHKLSTLVIDRILPVPPV